jgi:hypothetical protein
MHFVQDRDVEVDAHPLQAVLHATEMPVDPEG